MLDLNAKTPSGPLEQKWDQHRFSMKLVNPANKRRHSVIAKVSQDFGEKLTIGADVIYSKRNNHAALNRIRIDNFINSDQEN